jgi:hypothetical protein
MLAIHILPFLAAKVCTMGAGYSTSDLDLPGFTLAAPIMNVSPARFPGDPEAAARNEQAVFDSVKQDADEHLAKLREVYEAPLRQFLDRPHAYSRWRHLLARQGGTCSPSLFLEGDVLGGEIGMHVNADVPAVVQAVLAVQVAAHLARALQRPKPQSDRWRPREALVRELGSSLSAWPGTSVWELGQAAAMRAPLEALAAEPFSAKPGEAEWSEAVVADLARTKAKVLLAYLNGKTVSDEVLGRIARFRYPDMQALFVLVAGLASDSMWPAQRPKLSVVVGKARKLITPATELDELERHLLRAAAR